MRPVQILTDSCSDLTGELLEKYNIGMAVDLSSVEAFARQLEQFVENLTTRADEYRKDLEAANEEYSHAKLIRNILG